MDQTLEGYRDIHHVSGKKKTHIFRPKYIDLVQSVQSYLVYRYPATSAKHFSFANTAVDSVVNATSNLAWHSKTISRSYHLLTKNCLRMTALTARRTLQTRFSTLLGNNVTMTSMAAITGGPFLD